MSGARRMAHRRAERAAEAFLDAFDRLVRVDHAGDLALTVSMDMVSEIAHRLDAHVQVDPGREHGVTLLCDDPACTSPEHG